ncbi:hypothetical protein M422DRAFT_268051 [Sphaerobolus stellatus SS14]|uniref:Uncharacterized protein n=1 Tax=Sphaerobolus stellatus (strain SS14) TaxID=990650 RepID=A0A0C9UYF8_SPHS4|nr:hypothetical protein M422DRAFT_268051 [Sphaerobolus stellatus SS14]
MSAPAVPISNTATTSPQALAPLSPPMSNAIPIPSAATAAALIPAKTTTLATSPQAITVLSPPTADAIPIPTAVIAVANTVTGEASADKLVTVRSEEGKKITGPEGVSEEVYKMCLEKQLRDWHRGVAADYLKHFKNFSINEVLPENPSEKQKKAAEKIELEPQAGATSSSKMIIKQVHHNCTCDLWAKADPNYKTLEHDQMVEDGWNPEMHRSEAFPIQMAACQTLFEALLSANQVHWEEVASNLKHVEPDVAEITRMLPTLFVMIGDSIVQKTRWSLSVCLGGLNAEGKPQYFMEEWKPVHGGKLQDATNSQAFCAWDQVFRQSLANDFNSLVPGSSGKLLKKPPPISWESIYEDRMEPTKGIMLWVDTAQLPRDDFPLDSPARMTNAAKMELAQHILSRELQELLAEKKRGEKVLRPAGYDIIGEETFDLSGVSGLDSEDQLIVDSKHQKCQKQMGTNPPTNPSISAMKNPKRPLPTASIVATALPAVSSPAVSSSTAQQPKTTNQCQAAKLTASENVRTMTSAKAMAVRPAVAATRVSEAIDLLTTIQPPQSDISSALMALAKRANVKKPSPRLKKSLDALWLCDWHVRAAKKEEWDAPVQGEMGSSSIKSLRFIEASEVDGICPLGVQLDLAVPVDSLGKTEWQLFDDVSDAATPLPQAAQYPAVHEIGAFLDELEKHIQGGLTAIIAHPTDSHLSWLKIGGPYGANAILHFAKFLC